MSLATTRFVLAEPNEAEWEALEKMFARPDTHRVIAALRTANHIEVSRYPDLRSDCVGGMNSALVRSGVLTGRFRILASLETQGNPFNSRDLYLYEICSREEWRKRLVEEAEVRGS